MTEPVDHLAHYGVPGMKWGKKKIAAEKARNATIQKARGKQEVRKAELNTLTRKRLAATTKRGKNHLDAKIADKKFEIRYNDDAKIAAQRTTGEKILRGARITALMGVGLVGLNGVANIVDSELSSARNEGAGERLTREFIARTDAH